jgi:hypothetical protein
MKTGFVTTTVLLCLAAASCTSLTPAGERVRVTSNADAVRGCTLLGEVKGADRMWGGAAGQGIAENNAWNELKNRAAVIGADTVLLVTSSTGFSGARAIGEGYHCGSVDPAKEVMLSKITVSNFTRQAATNGQLVGSFDLSNDNDFAVMSVGIECSLSGMATQNMSALPALGPHQKVAVPSLSFGTAAFPDGVPVCRATNARRP